jgi:hypothetical protein
MAKAIHAPRVRRAMQLKKEDNDKDRQFVRQPTQDELDGALK